LEIENWNLEIYTIMSSNISQAIKAICDEKGIPYESVLETVKAALAAAYRKDFGNKLQNIVVEFDPETGKIDAFDVKTVVEDVPEEELQELAQETAEKPMLKEEPIKRDREPLNPALGDSEELEKKRFNPKTEIQLTQAREIKKSYKIGDVITTKLEVPGDFGRMAAQTAKQVIIQKLREAEREIVLSEFKSREDTIITGVVQRREGRLVLVDLGRATALLPPEHQISREIYAPGEHLKVYVVSVQKTNKGPEIIVSRSHENIVKKFFEMEIPEIASGVVQIKGIAREAGSRTKIAVWTDNENIDPIGSCIGQRGARVQTIISELKGEKIDIIEYSESPEEFIGNALSPAKISSITIDKENRTAKVLVSEDQLSLAIGKSGQNVRLAARLTGWKIDILTDRVVVATDAGVEILKQEMAMIEAPKEEVATLKEVSSENIQEIKKDTEEKPQKEKPKKEKKAKAEKKESKKKKKKEKE